MKNVGTKNEARKEKVFLAAASALIAVALLSGCGKKGEIELSEEEEMIASLVAGSAVLRDSMGQLRAIAPENLIEEAMLTGFDSSAARDSQTMATKTDSIVGMSETSEMLPQSFKDMLAHMKGKLNQTSEDFEVAFGIDYSGSMSDDIQSVIQGFVEITDSLEKVQAAGRGVRVAIVTFGMEGNEAVNLDLTSNLSDVKSTLQTLHSNYDRDSHSDSPGEASYHALNLVANNLSWTASTRFSLFVTDEESKEMSSGRQEDANYVAQVDADLKKNGVATSTYTILVQ